MLFVKMMEELSVIWTSTCIADQSGSCWKSNFSTGFPSLYICMTYNFPMRTYACPNSMVINKVVNIVGFGLET